MEKTPHHVALAQERFNRAVDAQADCCAGAITDAIAAERARGDQRVSEERERCKLIAIKHIECGEWAHIGRNDCPNTIANEIQAGTQP